MLTLNYTRSLKGEVYDEEKEQSKTSFLKLLKETETKEKEDYISTKKLVLLLTNPYSL